jgi:phosphoribosylglycinamide formyltransferase-1
MLKTQIAVLVSGGGTNLQALIDAQAGGAIKSGEIALVISSRSGAYALERAKNHGIPFLVLSKTELGSQQAVERPCWRLKRTQNRYDRVAGYMSILSADFTALYPGVF